MTQLTPHPKHQRVSTEGVTGLDTSNESSDCTTTDDPSGLEIVEV
ncbi:12886_t:CDS:2 [Funneliformis caledonium]|uniref:12886_t:CDS:1 n=1 Tax=Funneliformis caledonium TaxID=1117310 RepID=A0A9N9DC03_9GLOM|nr:12886_t:CDS:2 [Funneliformis caledonium]